MRKIKMKHSGHTIHVCEDGETIAAGEIGMFLEEYEWARKLSQSMHDDPEGQRAFWETLIERKLTIPGYILFCDFPKDVAESCMEKNAIAQKYSTQILAMLRGRAPKE